MLRRRFLVATAVLTGIALLIGVGCSSSPKSGKRKRTVLMTEYDDARAGEEASKDVASELGLLDDEALVAYVSGIGHKLLRGVPRRGFDYQFFVVDMVEPNAFALPGGYVFVSRGLLALANNEDELACVIGHEITHAAHRHAAAQQELSRRGNPLAMPWNRASRMAGYSREMERDADKGGQILCAAAGYDPMGMSTFLRNLGQSERLARGYSRAPTFYDTHPGAVERAAVNAVRAGEMRWVRDPDLGDPRAALLRHIDGLAVGQRPEAGVFIGDVFVHPDLDFQIRFPAGWNLSNTNRAVGAQAPRGDAVVFLTADVPPGEVEKVAKEWIDKEKETQSFNVEESKPVKVGKIDAWRMRISAGGGYGSLTSYVTFIPYGSSTWRVTGVSRAASSESYLGRTLATSRSFRPLTDRERDSVESARLRIVEADAGESIESLGRRSGNSWDVADTAVYNGVFIDHRFEAGDLVKIARIEAYTPASKASAPTE